MKILALDLSTTVIGYCYDGENGSPASGIIKAPQGNPFTRALFLSKEVVNLARLCTPDKIVKEELNSTRNLQVVKTLMRSEGQILTRLWDAGWSVDSLGCSEYRKAAGFGPEAFKGRGKIKERVQLWIESKGYKPVDDNESDALCLWLGAHCLYENASKGEIWREPTPTQQKPV